MTEPKEKEFIENTFCRRQLISQNGNEHILCRSLAPTRRKPVNNRSQKKETLSLYRSDGIYVNIVFFLLRRPKSFRFRYISLLLGGQFFKKPFSIVCHNLIGARCNGYFIAGRWCLCRILIPFLLYRLSAERGMWFSFMTTTTTTTQENQPAEACLI